MYDTTKPYLRDCADLIRETWENSPLLVMVDFGLFTKTQYLISTEMDHTDGIGTKGMLHWEHRTFANAVKDAMAMNLNDLAMYGATPYKLQNHIMVPSDDHEAIKEIIGALVEECHKYRIVITGGETSINNHMDISITMSAANIRHIPQSFEEGNVLIGLPSNGLHSNGFTRVREILGEHVLEAIPNALEPTEVYLGEVVQLVESVRVRSMVHVTGGGFTKLKSHLKGTDAVINRFATLDCFRLLYDCGISDEEMYRTFNCGIGFVIAVPADHVQKTLSLNKRAVMIGSVRSGSGKVRIDSAFSDKTLEV